MWNCADMHAYMHMTHTCTCRHACMHAHDPHNHARAHTCKIITHARIYMLMYTHIHQTRLYTFTQETICRFFLHICTPNTYTHIHSNIHKRPSHIQTYMHTVDTHTHAYTDKQRMPLRTERLNMCMHTYTHTHTHDTNICTHMRIYTADYVTAHGKNSVRT